MKNSSAGYKTLPYKGKFGLMYSAVSHLADENFSPGCKTLPYKGKSAPQRRVLQDDEEGKPTYVTGFRQWSLTKKMSAEFIR